MWGFLFDRLSKKEPEDKIRFSLEKLTGLYILAEVKF
nr:MAG TPA: hypothetical protein [Caudoviricetes sp.]